MASLEVRSQGALVISCFIIIFQLQYDDQLLRAEVPTEVVHNISLLLETIGMFQGKRLSSFSEVESSQNPRLTSRCLQTS